jgi:F-box protein 18 (helicase)
MLDILMRQATPKIIVGDPNQQIYMFRGAVNALDSVQADNVFYLTQSFRFGPEIAYVANCCLTTLKGKDDRTLVGGKKRDFLKEVSPETSECGGQVAILAATNAKLFTQAVHLICHSSRAIQPTGYFAGGIKEYRNEIDQITFVQYCLKLCRCTVFQTIQLYPLNFLRHTS